jgi:hypothetical protein
MIFGCELLYSALYQDIFFLMVQVNVTLIVRFIQAGNENGYPVVVLLTAMNYKYYEKSIIVYPAGVAAVCRMPQNKQPDGV